MLSQHDRPLSDQQQSFSAYMQDLELTDISGGPKPIKAQLFFKDYYTDTADMGTQFTRERKVKIWMNNCSFQCRTSISDISNAWTNMI